MITTKDELQNIFATVPYYRVKSFCKDYAIPIPVLEEPHFSYYFDMIDPMFHTYKKFNSVIEILELFDFDSEKVSNHVHNITNQMIDFIRNADSYKFLTDMDMKDLNRDIPITNRMSMQDMYIVKNVGKYIISIDLCEANFQCLDFFDSEHNNCNGDLFHGHHTYNSFARTFTDLDYILNSKRRRQYVFGNINTKRQHHVQKYMMEIIDTHITMKHPSVSFNMMSYDEIFCVIDNYDDAKKFYDDFKIILDKLKKTLQIRTTIELVELNHLNIDKGFIKKDCIDGSIKIKGIPIDKFIQYFKYYYLKQPVEDADLYFMNGDDLCKYVRPVIKA